MAEIKSIIKGTVNALGGKAKELAESGAVRDAYDRGLSAVRAYTNIAKLTLQINGELEEQKDIFAEIGRLYYAETGGFSDGDYAALFDAVKLSDERIETMRSELDAAKAAVVQ